MGAATHAATFTGPERGAGRGLHLFALVFPVGFSVLGVVDQRVCQLQSLSRGYFDVSARDHIIRSALGTDGPHDGDREGQGETERAASAAH